MQSSYGCKKPTMSLEILNSWNIEQLQLHETLVKYTTVKEKKVLLQGEWQSLNINVFTKYDAYDL
jgi:hypothetical protein